jgi:hypothetical protein
MHNEHIISLANAFYKSAGVFEAPPAMVERLVRAAKGLYASAILYHIENDLHDLQLYPNHSIKELEAVKQKALQYANVPRAPNDRAGKLPIDLAGWKYLKPDLGMLYRYWIKEGFRKPYIQCHFVFGERSDQGYYDPTTNVIVMYIDNRSERFDFTMRELEKTARHELQHFGQALLSDLLRKSYMVDAKNPHGDMAGIPSNKIRSKDYSPHGISLKTRQRDQEHALHDVEFYTNLQDNIDMFIDQAKNLIRFPGSTKQLFNMFVGMPNTFVKDQWARLKADPGFDRTYKDQYLKHIVELNNHSNMFKIMLAKDPAKWRKAVNVFYTSVSGVL